MENLFTREQVVREIELMPEEYLGDVYRLLHFFRLGLKSEKSESRQPKHILQFAGSWNRWSDAEFSAFLDEVGNRRQVAFKARRVE